MNNTQLDKMLNNKNGFWVRLKDVDDNTVGPAAKILINEEGLTLFTLLDEAPAINVYEPNKFMFLSTDRDVVLRVAKVLYMTGTGQTVVNHQKNTQISS